MPCSQDTSIRRLVDESIQIYNERRPHLLLNYKTPDEVHRAFYT
ncbi:hypothetical protein HMPREF0693_0773 [Proteus mirabilis ATCC 29906]|nr:hypothetical protein HMPREF0693_0773 [Proteus mirabilis ATCC 29906]QEQ99465.1 transposase [Proteus mirabilis]